MNPGFEQVVLVTGATSGLGRAVAAAGSTVLIHGRSQERDAHRRLRELSDRLSINYAV